MIPLRENLDHNPLLDQLIPSASRHAVFAYLDSKDYVLELQTRFNALLPSRLGTTSVDRKAFAGRVAEESIPEFFYLRHERDRLLQLCLSPRRELEYYFRIAASYRSLSARCMFTMLAYAIALTHAI